MSIVAPLPRAGTVLRDPTRPQRTLRISWHDDQDLAVLSIWDGPVCTGTFRLRPADVPALTAALLAGPLAD